MQQGAKKIITKIEANPLLTNKRNEFRQMRVAAYCRVSTAEEAQVGSFEMQVQHFQSLIDSNPRYELVKIYKDEGISGTQVKKRQGFQAMIDDAVAGKIDLILTMLPTFPPRVLY